MISRFHFIFVRCMPLIIVIMLSACSGSSTPEPDRIATRVAEDLFVAQTLTAVAEKAQGPTMEVAQITSTFTPAPATNAPVATDTSLPPTPRPTEIRPPTAVPTCASYHQVQYGETFYSIAGFYGITPQALMAINNIYSANLIYAGQMLCIPAGAPVQSETTGSRPRPTEAHPPTLVPGGIYYTVRWGDTLASISARYGVSVYAIMQANRLANTYIYVGMLLWIPCGSCTPTAPPPAESQPPTLVPPPSIYPPPATTSKPAQCAYYHQVSSGETLYSIARRYGVTVQAVMSANNIANPNLIPAGLTLCIPADASASSTSAGQEVQPTERRPPTLVPPPYPYPPPATTATPAQCAYYHQVSSGETLYSIARRYGITLQAVMSANNIANPNLISAGLTLCIPAGASAPGAPAVQQPRPTETRPPTAIPSLTPTPG